MHKKGLRRGESFPLKPSLGSLMRLQTGIDLNVYDSVRSCIQFLMEIRTHGDKSWIFLLLIFLSVLKKCPFDHTVLIISVKLKLDRYFFLFFLSKDSCIFLIWHGDTPKRIFVLKLSTNSGKTRKNMCLFDTFVSLNKHIVWFCVPHCTLSKLFLRSKFFTTGTKRSKNFSKWSYCDSYVPFWHVCFSEQTLCVVLCSSLYFK